MAAHVSLANGPPVLIGDVPDTVAALCQRVKSVPPHHVHFSFHALVNTHAYFLRWQVLKLDEDAKISLQYQNESGARVDVTSDGDLKVSEAESNSHYCVFVCLPLLCCNCT